MPAIVRRWQARVEITNYDEEMEPVVFHIVSLYGETIDILRATVRTYLLSNIPTVSFSNVGDHITGYVEYRIAPDVLPDGERDKGSLESIQLWWWRDVQTMLRGKKQYEPSEVFKERMESFEEAVDDFVENALIPEKGPDYHSKALVGSSLHLPLLEKVLREAEEHPTNDLIQRGWHIIALEYKGEQNKTGELMNRKAIFVMGHPEIQAAAMTLDSLYYTYNQRD